MNDKCTDALKHGADLLGVKDLLGHTEVSTTQLNLTSSGEDAKCAQSGLKFG